MEQQALILADTPGFGRIFDCGECGHIHVTIGPVSLTLEMEAYFQLVALVHTSAANFETYLQARPSEAAPNSGTEQVS
ncbi:hypothetical protein [Bryobacter aggregatus]|uniref:hypothetical protein n=1 Tax=Bryobacter aggregatus TaxID=360054 RepID=UPI0004E0CAD6|nr:hypothetical protein [Bryobacter aggregatus]